MIQNIQTHFLKYLSRELFGVVWLANEQYIKKYLKLKTYCEFCSVCCSFTRNSYVVTINFQKTDYEIRLLRIKFNYSFIIRKDANLIFARYIFLPFFFYSHRNS